MQISLEQYERIQNYLDGLLTPQEEEDFLKELNHDLPLKESFEFEKKLRDNLASMQDKKDFLESNTNNDETVTRDEDYDSITSLIEKAGNEWEEENKRSSVIHALVTGHKPRPQKAKILNMRSWSVIAAAACVVLAVASLILFMPESSSPPPIAKTNDTSASKKTNEEITHTTPEEPGKTMIEIKQVSPTAVFKKYYTKDAANPSMPDLLAMVPADYQKGDYSYRDIPLKAPLMRGSSNDRNSRQNILQFGHYYKGLSYIETSDNEQAIENLNWVMDSAQSTQLKLKAQWYLALIYLKENNIKKATTLLSIMSKNSKDDTYQKQSIEILAALKDQEKP